MAFHDVTSCCGVCSLRTGCLIIGWITCAGATFDCLRTVAVHGEKMNSFDIVKNAVELLCLMAGNKLLLGAYKRDAVFFMAYLILNVLLMVFCVTFSVVALALSDKSIKSITMAVHASADDVTPNRFILVGVLGLATVVLLYCFSVANEYRFILMRKPASMGSADQLRQQNLSVQEICQPAIELFS